MPSFWYASFVFLGLSISIGLLIYMIQKDRKRSGRDGYGHKDRSSRDVDKKSKSLLEELEEKYGKKG
jgi:hypothetical protein